MNDNTVLRIKVPAHLYESVKEQLTLSEAKKGKHNLGAGMEIVKEKKMKAPKDGMKKVEEVEQVEETKDELQEIDPNALDTAIRQSYVGMHPDTAAVLDIVMQLGAAGLGSAAIIAILYANKNKFSGGKQFARNLIAKAKGIIGKVVGGVKSSVTPTPGQKTATNEVEVKRFSPEQEKQIIQAMMESLSEEKTEKKDRTMEEMKKAKDMLEMKIKKMEESLNEKKHKEDEEQ